MRVRMTPRLESPALTARSPEEAPRGGRASLRPWARVLLGRAFVALCLVSPASAALISPEEGEAQLLELFNKDREVKLRRHGLLGALADWQACSNARRRAVGEIDDLGQDFRARCLRMGLIGKTMASVTADEFYFRTTHAYGGALIFDPMVAEAHAKRYDFVGIRCVEGDDGMFYWCITLYRDERIDRLAGLDVPGRLGPSEGPAGARGVTAPPTGWRTAPTAGQVARVVPPRIARGHRRDQCPRSTRHSASSNVVRYGVSSTCRLTA
jgi:hypothetical protein